MLEAEDGAKRLKAHQRLAEGEKDLNWFAVLSIGPAAAMEFDRLRQNKKLKTIGRGDLLIAALILANRATLAQLRNRRDFGRVPGLKVENWAD